MGKDKSSSSNKEARGYIVPEIFTHGTSKQSVKWFKKGFNDGTLEGGDTFNTKDL
ncbi:neutral zinc metallopeptidase [Viridibacillus sp. YIM B01967]|uniref:Neutral zinc metallopeptidase n=1 Tax=Viridibacillus soli TaxID=2798301 RepID=A0ABS1H5F8_9BACL|nr:neutral zinc metallopeptidase [Viridibacillus soli]